MVSYIFICKISIAMYFVEWNYIYNENLDKLISQHYSSSEFHIIAFEHYNLQYIIGILYVCVHAHVDFISKLIVGLSM